jgi:hypothetical protein
MSSLALWLMVAAVLAFAIGLAHSVLGERYILVRLFRRGNLPQLFGGTIFTERTLRFAWHLTTVAWWGAGAMFFCMAQGPLSSSTVSAILAVVFLASGTIALVGSRGRHLSWLVFLIIGVIALYGAHA